MNTIRRTITKSYPCHMNESMTQTDELSFEGEKGKFNLCIEHYNPFEGTQRTRINLDHEDARILLKSLETFLK